jgi:hypothetical protein
MTLGERCDEIVRLIEETLADLASVVEPAGSLVDPGMRVDPAVPVEPVLARVGVGSHEAWMPVTAPVEERFLGEPW